MTSKMTPADYYMQRRMRLINGIYRPVDVELAVSQGNEAMPHNAPVFDTTDYGLGLLHCTDSGPYEAWHHATHRDKLYLKTEAWHLKK